jgi:hypothetical protein
MKELMEEPWRQFPSELPTFEHSYGKADILMLEDRDPLSLAFGSPK